MMSPAKQYWLSLGLLGALPLLAYYFMIAPARKEKVSKEDQLSQLTSKLEAYLNDAASIRSGPEIEKYQERKNQIATGIKHTMEHYRNADMRLDRWFPGLQSPAPEQGPPRPEFIARFNVEKSTLENDLKSLLPPQQDPHPGDGAGQRSTSINWPDQAKLLTVEHFLRAQQQYWICRQIISIMQGLKLNINSAQIVLDTGTLSPVETPSYTLVFETDRKVVVGRTLPFQVILEMQYKDVPLLMRALLYPSTEEALYFNIRTCVIETTLPKKPPERPEFGQDEAILFNKRFQDLETVESGKNESVKPVMIKIVLGCDVIDLDWKTLQGLLK